MNNEDMMDLVLGVGVVVIGWHLYKMYKAQQAPGPAGNAPIPNIPAAPLIQQNPDGTYFVDMDTLLLGVL